MNGKPVKIVATLGPSTHAYESILNLARTGVDVFRFTMAHANPVEVAEAVTWIRDAEGEIGRPLAIMGDLSGPKIRISDVMPDTTLEKGQTFIISKDIVMGDENGCGINHHSVLDFIEPGSEVFIDDGTIKLHVDKKKESGIETTVLAGGLLKPHKGFSAEGLVLKLEGVTEKDKESIALMLELEVDALAVSFVQTAQDIKNVRELLPEHSKIMLIAKIETADGVANAEEILEEANGMMIARGDLGLAVPIAKVPHIQKQLIDLCVKNAKPVITATQMLESMVSKPIPTRAEVGDVANAILDRTDAIMLSAETAVGKFPAEAVDMMVKIIAETVSHISIYEYNEKKTTGNAISDAAGNIADLIGAKVIIALTESGKTARKISRHRHQIPIISVSQNIIIMRRLNFTWGVYPHMIGATKDFEDMLKQAKEIARKNRVIELSEGEKYVISAGIPFGKPGTTNMILVQKV
jgi:pyruvate kinase